MIMCECVCLRQAQGDPLCAVPFVGTQVSSLCVAMAPKAAAMKVMKRPASDVSTEESDSGESLKAMKAMKKAFNNISKKTLWSYNF